MLPFLAVFHDSGDDLAPRDYAAVPSVSEGMRRERAQGIHRAPGQDGLVPPASLLRKPAALNPVDEYGIPEDPFHPPQETQRPRRSRVARHAETPAAPEPAQSAAPTPPRPMTGARTAVPKAPQGPQFAQPASPEIPDWLKVARQNQPAVQPRPQGPRVQAASRQSQPSDSYAQAGYPEDLLQAQRQLEQQSAAMPVRRRHGAQYAVKPDYAPQPVRPTPVRPQPMAAPQPTPAPTEEAMMSRAYHRPRREAPEACEVEEDEADERALPGLRIPWLAIAAFAAVLAAVLLWVMTSSARNQTAQILADRAAREAQILEDHPLPYQSLISDKANKYNLHPAFVAAIMLNESSFRPEATSSVDARGLMQLMDDTAGWIYEKMGDDSRPYSFDDLYDPEINAEYGCWYLNYLSGLFRGDPILVAAAFHAGQGEVRNWLNDSAYSRDGLSIRLEDMIDGPTKRYVTRVLSDYAAYKRLYFGG